MTLLRAIEFSFNCSTYLDALNGNSAGLLTYYYFGFPAQILDYHGGLNISFNPIGYLLNFYVFYWLFRLLNWVIKT